VQSYGPLGTQASAVLSNTRVRDNGDPVDMLVESLYQRVVGYLVGDFWQPESQQFERMPIGTTFFVERDLGPGLGSRPYAVTCRHVIEQFRHHVAADTCRGVFLRVNGKSGLAQDVPMRVEDWVLSGNTDLAIAKLNLTLDTPFWCYPIERPQPFGLFEGRGVFFVGMFAESPGIISVQPVVRSGTIARVSASVSVTPNPHSGEEQRISAHLVEAWSWGGESGSPVFAYDDRDKSPKMGFNPGYGVGFELRPALLGVLYGHYRVNLPADMDANSGISIVIPKGAINELLMAPQFV
jgi:hypothetical protein